MLNTLSETAARLSAFVSSAWSRYKAFLLQRQSVTLSRAYLPAVVELEEVPPSPTARILIWSILGFVCVALLWSILGHIDIVATGNGKTVPTGRVKVIQPLESGVIKAIYVQDGQAVKAGDPLLDLDVTITQAEEERLQSEKDATYADMLRLQSLLSNQSPTFPVNIASETLQTQTNLFFQAREEYHSQLNSLKEQLLQKEHELQSTQAEVQKLQQTLPLVTARAESFKRLSEKGFVAKNQSLSLEEQRIQQTYDLKAARARVSELRAAVQDMQQRIFAAEATFKTRTLGELNEKEQKYTALLQDLAKAVQRNRYQRLTAPIDGTVQELKVHTVGGVVTPAQELMKVVPQEDALEVEVFIPNRDIGFVREGQPVRIKLEAFPFTKYGVLEGHVKKLSLDAIPDEKLGLVYAARIRLKSAILRVEGRDMLLTSGLQASAEIKTGTRRIIEYFLSPLMQYTDEAIRER